MKPLDKTPPENPVLIYFIGGPLDRVQKTFSRHQAEKLSGRFHYAASRHFFASSMPEDTSAIKFERATYLLKKLPINPHLFDGQDVWVAIFDGFDPEVNYKLPLV